MLHPKRAAAELNYSATPSPDSWLVFTPKCGRAQLRNRERALFIYRRRLLGKVEKHKEKLFNQNSRCQGIRSHVFLYSWQVSPVAERLKSNDVFGHWVPEEHLARCFLQKRQIQGKRKKILSFRNGVFCVCGRGKFPLTL